MLLCATLLASGRGTADPRGIGEPPAPLTPELIEARRAKLSRDMAAWLPRLVGRFQVDGVAELESTSLKGSTVRWIYETRCESDSSAMKRCRRITRFYAPPDSNRVQLVIEFEQWGGANDWVPMSRFALDMVREAEEQQSYQFQLKRLPED